MTDPVSSRWAPPRPPAAYTKASFLSFYSGMAAMTAMVFLVVVYYFLLHRLNFDNRNRRADLRNRQFHRHPNHGLDKSIWVLIPAYKYMKKESQTQVPDEQCTVCLSVFADGEDVRQLPECKHCFHADCIDMWFYSHSNCPLCRASLEGLPRRLQALKREADFQGGLSDASAMV